MTETVAPSGDTTQDEAAVSRFIENFAQMFVEAGMPRIASRIIAALMTTDSGTMTAADLSELLRASPAAISGGIRYLVQVGLASRGREPGSRRDYYRVENNVWYQAMAQSGQLLVRWVTSLREGVEVVGSDTPAGLRFAESSEFFDFMRQELQLMMERWQERQASKG